jgi:DNA-binding NarL/FixJ family response regulator
VIPASRITKRSHSQFEIASNHTNLAEALEVPLEQIKPEAGLSLLLLLTVARQHYLSYGAIALRVSNKDVMSRALSQNPGQAGSDDPRTDLDRTNCVRKKDLPRFLIADDHTIFADALRILLEKTYPVIGVVPDGRALIEAARRLGPDVIVADVAMPVLNGLDAARRIKEEAPKIKFIFLTMHVDPNLAAAALELGPIGFVLKHATGTDLLKAIDRVLVGKSYLSPQLKSADWAATKIRARQFTKELTQRQREIVQLYAEGRPLKEIASLLNLSEKTVEFHKHHIMEAFHLKSNAELILYALKQGLISIDPELATRARPPHDKK